MKTVEQLIKELKQYPIDAKCFAYEGSNTGIVINIDDKQEMIMCSESDDPIVDIEVITVTDISDHDMHSEAGQAKKITCPICHSEVIFAAAQWWVSECKCGEWELTIEATLTINHQE